MGERNNLGFEEGFRPDFEYFLSCGKEGMEGERYKKTPELVREIMKKMPSFRAPSRFLVFKRWDMLNEDEEPQIVIFFVNPDILAGLYTLANFDKTEDNVISPFGSGCSTLVLHPYLQNLSSDPKCVIGLFDVSARPFIDSNVLSFSAPFKRFTEMIENMDESFLITRSWKRIRRRIK